jgi:N-acetylmuramoyl-L-alanine amidase CwlA
MSRAKLTNLFDARYKVYFCERQLGISHLSDTTKSVYELIAKQEMTIQRIVDHKYFSGVCLSTVKRSVVELLNENMITATTGSKDKRERILTLRIT